MIPRLAVVLLLSCGVARAELVCPVPEFVVPNEVRSGEPLRHRFELHNAGTEAVEVLGLKPGCGCLSPHIDRTRLSPGESATVAVEVNTVTQGEGRNAWRVTVRYRHRGKEAELPLTVSAMVRHVVTISPANLVVHTSTGYTHSLTLTEKTPGPMAISAAVAGSPHVRATAGKPIRVGDAWRREIKLEILPTCPDGRLEDVLSLTTPGRPDLRFPFAVVKHTAAVVRAAPPAVRLQSVGSQALPARIVLLSRGDDGPVAVERVEADHPAVAATWIAGPDARATLRVVVDRAAIGAVPFRATVRVHLRGAEPVEVPVFVDQ
jgi:hypothetical protein